MQKKTIIFYKILDSKSGSTTTILEDIKARSVVLIIIIGVT